MDMHFKYEADMTGPVLNWLRDQNLFIKTEFPTSWGICDIIAVDFNEKHLKIRHQLGQVKSINSVNQFSLIQHIPDIETGKSVTINKLKKLESDTYLSFDIKDQLHKLIKGKFVISHKKGHYQKVNGWMPLFNKIIAIELKLNRINDAIFQASNNLKMATESYVALPHSVANRVNTSPKISHFINNGIGLIAVYPYKCEVLLKPHANIDNIDTAIQSLITERFWKMWLKGN
jgi:hypothetical protein